MKKIFSISTLLVLAFGMVSIQGWSQIARWNFFGQSSPTTSSPTATNANVTVSALTRGPGATSSTATNSFRTVGFKNDGIATTNADYFQFSITPNSGFTLSLSSLASIFNGTASFYASPGVTSQYAYSFDGTNYTLITPASTVTAAPSSTTTTLSGTSALQNIPSTNILYIRYYASGQTATGGWGYYSASAATIDDGLSLAGTVTSTGGATPPTLTTTTNPASVDNNFTVTYPANPAFTGAITSITISPGGTLTAGTDYTLSGNNTITFTPGTTGNSSLRTPGTYTITVNATGYTSATVSQTLTVGAATKLVITTQPTAPAANGGMLAMQPAVSIQDKYNNTVTTSSSNIVASVGSGTFTLGGTTTKAASSGIATYTDLTATSTVAITGATITFTSGSLTITSNPFNIPAPAIDYINITSPGTVYSQDFNSLTTTGTSSTLPIGWALYETGSAANTAYTAGTGSGTTGDTYSFGSSASTDRAFGGLQSGSVVPTIGAKYQNSTGSSIQAFSISYTGEQWRLGAIGRLDKLQFEYSTDATSLSTGTWTPFTPLDFIAPVTTGTVGALDGNVTANRTFIFGSINGLNISNSNTFWIRYTDYNATGADDGLGIDDFSITVCTTPPATPTVNIMQPNCTTSTGTITVTAPIGTGITYSIDGTTYQSGTTFTGLTSGTYSITAQNTGGCISSATSATVNAQPATPAAPTLNVTQPTCTSATGTITVTAPTGSGFTYSINGSTYTNTTGIFSNVSPATYSVTDKNSAGCISAATPATVNAQPATPAAPTVNVTQPTCTTSTGTITITSPTGSGITYSIDGSTYTNTTGTFSNVSPGTYSVTAKNSTGCISAPTSATVNAQPATPAVPTVNVTQPTCSPTGTITVTAPTGSGISYSINGSDYSNTTGVFSNVNPGTYSVTAKSSAGCISNTTSVTVNAQPADTWTGAVSTSVTNSANWTCGVPTATTDVLIPVVSSGNYPFINGAYTIHDITIASGATLTIDSATVGVLTIKGAFSNAGVLTNNGRIVLNGTAAQSFPGGSIANLSMNTLEINNTSGVTLDNSIIIRGAILPTAGTTALGSNYITLRSDSINIGGTPQFRSARIGVDGSATPFTYGTGRFVIERYFHAKRAWRLITAPVTMASSSTIFNGWQLGGRTTASTPPAASGTGVLITGAYTTTNGFDINGTNKNPSLKIHDPVTGALNSVPGTKIKLSPGTYATGGTGENIGYFNFVRGDRDPSLLTLTKTNRTTLRDTGIVQTGTQTFTFPLAVNTNPKFILLPNPYASPVDFQTIYNNNQSNIEERFYAWDPELGDATSVGGYVTYDLLSGPTPDNPPGHQNQYIQSTQAVYLQTSNSGSVPVTVNESDKAPDTINAPLFRPLIYATSQLRVNLNFVNADNSTLLADGILAQFSSAYSDAVDKNDGLKFLNPAESFAFSRDGKLLSIERRNQLTKEDTLYFSFTKGTKRTYQLEFVPDGLDGTAAFLIDSYLKTSTPVSMSQASTLNFTITTDAGSAAADRFMIVFRPSATLPVTFTKVKAYQQGSNINVEWNIENEQNIKEYEVERSTDGRTFSKSITLTATRNNGTTAAYTWPDASPANGANYYRIKSVSKSGEIRYSSIVKVTIGNGRPLIAVYPNPASGGTINLQLINQPAGRYGIRLLDKIGQVILVKQTEHSEGSSTETLQVSEAMAHGNYQLEITKPDNNKIYINVLY